MKKSRLFIMFLLTAPLVFTGCNYYESVAGNTYTCNEVSYSGLNNKDISHYNGTYTFTNDSAFTFTVSYSEEEENSSIETKEYIVIGTYTEDSGYVFCKANNVEKYEISEVAATETEKTKLLSDETVTLTTLPNSTELTRIIGSIERFYKKQ